MNTLREPEPGSPTNRQIGKPSDISSSSSQARMFIEPITQDISEIKSDVKEINKNRHDDFVKLLIIYGSGFVVLAAMIIAAYLLLDHKVSAISDLSIKVDTKLEELIKRIPPVQALPVKR